MPKTEHMITPDGDLHVYNARIAEYNGWLKATPAEVKAHFEAHLVVVEDENPELPEEAQESGDEELTTANARIKELEEKLARKDIGTASALPVQSKPASNDENDSQETGGEEEKNDPDTCETLGEAVATVNSMTSNECDAYASKLGMEPFGSRVKVGDKQDTIITKMEELAAAAK